MLSLYASAVMVPELILHRIWDYNWVDFLWWLLHGGGQRAQNLASNIYLIILRKQNILLTRFTQAP